MAGSLCSRRNRGRKEGNACYKNPIIFITPTNFCFNQNYNKILEFDWLSTGPIWALIGQCNWTVRVMPV